MWTPRRIVLLAIGFAGFFAAYFVYALFLGGLDGLPPLPADYLPIDGPVVEFVERRQENSVDEQLRLAFGQGCPEKEYKIKLELEPRGMVIATEDAKVQDDGTVKLTPFRLAIIKKDPGGDQKEKEINTVKCNQAILRFDRPVKGPFEIGGNRKIVGGRLEGKIELVNNRGTKRDDDDISLSTEGPLEYDEARHLVWIDKAIPVRVVDLQSKPKPMEITGFGMDIELANEPRTADATHPNSRKARNDGPSGINRIRLQNDVNMDLSVDGQADFFGTAKKEASARPVTQKGTAANATSKEQLADKANVHIFTQGPFSYDLRTDRATFEIAHKPDSRPNVITLDKFKDSEGKIDHLQCDERLDIQFQRKNKTAAPASVPTTNAVRQGNARPDGPADNLEIQSAHAIGKEVVISSDAEMLDAHGTDLVYDRSKQLTTLKGTPMWAIKEGTEIRAAELQLVNAKDHQKATALGEGHISLFDKTTNKRSMEASWKRSFVYTKEGNVDVLTLVGDAVFMDKERQQQLKAETLKVWLAPADPGTAAGGEEQRRKPQRLDALEHVSSEGPDLHIHDTEHLEVYFADVAPTPRERSAQGEATNAALSSRQENDTAAGDAKSKEGPGTIPAIAANRRPRPEGGLFPGAPAENGKNKKPIDLSAKLVQTYVLRSDNKNDLDRVNCEGAVRVFQEPTAPGEKGVDIRGEYLQLKHHLDGNQLRVRGEYAQVQMNQVFIVGPVVTIDQVSNEAWVDGVGVMKLPSKNNLDGTPRAQETELVITWEKAMWFDGQRARFEGKVKATQDQGRLATDVLKVGLDRKVSLREGGKNSPPAKMQNLLCERSVWVEDTVLRGGKLVSHKRIQGAELFADSETENNDSKIEVAGPGAVRIFQVGQKGQLLPGQNPNPGQVGNAPTGPRNVANDTKNEEFKLTQVTFQGKMQANNKTGIADFWDDVVVFQVPTEDRDLKINDLSPPPQSMRLSCKHLRVLSQKNANGVMQQAMHADGKVLISGQDFAGSADTIDYDEGKDQVILRGTPGNKAVLVKQPVKGGQRDVHEADLIMYWPKTGQIVTDGASKFEGSR